LASAGVSHDIIRGEYLNVHGGTYFPYEQELENMQVATQNTKQIISPHQDTRTPVAAIGAGGAAPPKKKNKAPKKKTK
jgi:hypothetical protein